MAPTRRLPTRPFGSGGSRCRLFSCQGASAATRRCCLLSRCHDAFLGQGSEVRVELDAEPVPPECLGDDGRRARADEGVEDDAGLRRSIRWTTASPLEIADHRQPTVLLRRCAYPRRTARGANLLRAGGEERPLHQPAWVDGVVGALVAGSRNAPDISGVLAHRMTTQTDRLQPIKPVVATSA